MKNYLENYLFELDTLFGNYIRRGRNWKNLEERHINLKL